MNIFRTTKISNIVYAITCILSLWANVGRGGVDELETHIRWLLSANERVAIIVLNMQTGLMNKETGMAAMQVDDDFLKRMGIFSDFLGRFSQNKGIFFYDINRVSYRVVTPDGRMYLPPTTGTGEIKEVAGSTFPELLATMKAHEQYALVRGRSDFNRESFPKIVNEHDNDIVKLPKLLRSENIRYVVLIGSDVQGFIRSTAKQLLRKNISVIVDEDLIVTVGAHDLSGRSPVVRDRQMRAIQQKASDAWDQLAADNPHKVTLTHRALPTAQKCIQNP